MRRIAAVFLGLLVAIGPALGIPGPVAADAATGTPTVVTPAAGTTVARPFTGPITIDFTNAEPGTWTVLVSDALSESGHGYYYRSPTADGYYPVTVEPGTGTVDIPLDTPIKKSGRIRVEITGPSGGAPAVTSTFTVDGGGKPRFLAPVEGQTVAPGYTGPVKIDFSDAPLGPYRLEVYGNDSDYYDTIRRVDNTNDTGTLDFDLWNPIPADGNYYAHVDQAYDYGNPAMDLVTFHAATPLTIGTISATPATFYPRVRDDYRDSTRIDYTTNLTSDVTATVLNSAGDTVFEEPVASSLPPGSHDWEWDGRNDDGVAMPVGTYRVRLHAVDARGEQATATVKVTVASDIVTRTVTRTKDGVSTSHRYALGCETREDDPRLTLDCWGGKYADAIYRFTIPRDAWALAWTVTGKRMCCDRGKLIRTGTRPNKTTFRVHVGVTGWRAYTIRSVTLTYKHKQRR